MERQVKQHFLRLRRGIVHGHPISGFLVVATRLAIIVDAPPEQCHPAVVSDYRTQSGSEVRAVPCAIFIEDVAAGLVGSLGDEA